MKMYNPPHPGEFILATNQAIKFAHFLRRASFHSAVYGGR